MDESEIGTLGIEQAINLETTRTKKASKKEKITKKVLHPLFGKDLYALGKLEFAKKDVIAVRKDKERRLQEKSNIRRCIIGQLSEGGGYYVSFGEENDVMPPLQRHVRGRVNNLNLGHR